MERCDARYPILQFQPVQPIHKVKIVVSPSLVGVHKVDENGTVDGDNVALAGSVLQHIVVTPSYMG